MKHFASVPAFILVDVLFRNRTLTAVLDTGALLTAIDSKVLNDIDPAIAGRLKEQVTLFDTTGAPLKTGKIFLSDFTAIHEIKNVSIAITDLGPLSQSLCQKIDLILGMNAIKELNWSFDLESKTWGSSIRNSK